MILEQASKRLRDPRRSVNGKLGLFVGNVNVVHVEAWQHPLANVRLGSRIHPRNEGPTTCE